MQFDQSYSCTFSTGNFSTCLDIHIDSKDYTKQVYVHVFAKTYLNI